MSKSDIEKWLVEVISHSIKLVYENNDGKPLDVIPLESLKKLCKKHGIRWPDELPF